jgi:hypothetical protein
VGSGGGGSVVGGESRKESGEGSYYRRRIELSWRHVFTAIYRDIEGCRRGVRSGVRVSYIERHAVWRVFFAERISARIAKRGGVA